MKKLETQQVQLKAGRATEPERSKRLEHELQTHLSAKVTIAALRGKPKRVVRKMAARILNRAIRYALAHPRVRVRAKSLLHLWPSLFNRVKSFALSKGLVRGVQQATTFRSASVHVFHVSLASGFYPVELLSSIPTYWIKASAVLAVHSTEECNANLHFRAFSFHRPRTLEVYAGDELVSRSTIPTSSESVEATLTMSRGLNRVHLRVLEGCERPYDIDELESADSRCLSIAVQNIVLNEKDLFHEREIGLSKYARKIYSDLNEAVREREV
ncbi:MAG: hypothetical protein ABSG38_04610 [Spirochaetia bacterium]|jgi:hypothetical protein